MKIVIYTSFDCLIKVDEEEIFLDQNQHLELNSFSSFHVFPVGKNKKFSFNVNLNDQENSFYRIIKQENKTLVFLLDGTYVENSNIYNIYTNGQNTTIEVASQSISFYSEKKKKTLFFPSDITNANCGKLATLIFVKFKSNDKYHLALYNNNTNMSKVFTGEEIELADNSFSIISNEDCVGKTKLSFFVDKEGLKHKDSSILTFASPPEELLPLYFLNAVKVKDYALAHTLLSPDLQCSLSQNGLKDFFGHISFIKPMDTTTIFAISNNKSLIYSFSTRNGKVCEIDDGQ